MHDSTRWEIRDHGCPGCAWPLPVHFMSFSDFQQLWCTTAVECTSHRSEAKKLHIYTLMADSVWEGGQDGKECQCAEPHKKVQAMFLSFQQGTDQHWVLILSILPGISGGSRWRWGDQTGTDLQSPGWVWVLLLHMPCSFYSSNCWSGLMMFSTTVVEMCKSFTIFLWRTIY